MHFSVHPLTASSCCVRAQLTADEVAAGFHFSKTLAATAAATREEAVNFGKPQIITISSFYQAYYFQAWKGKAQGAKCKGRNEVSGQDGTD